MACEISRTMIVSELNEAMKRAVQAGATEADLVAFREALRELDQAVVGRRLRQLKLRTLGQLQAFAIDAALLRLTAAIQEWEEGQPRGEWMRRQFADLRMLCLSTPATDNAALQPQEEER
jgi:hypothetical protein